MWRSVRSISSHPRSGCGAGGFTMIELLLVIVVLSLLYVAAAPAFSGWRGPGLDAAARVIKSDILMTQRRAMAEGASRSIVFTGGGSGYGFVPGPGGLPSQTRDLSGFGAGVAVQTGLTLSFNSLGEPLAESETVVTITDGSRAATVTVTPYTGKVTLGGP